MDLRTDAIATRVPTPRHSPAAAGAAGTPRSRDPVAAVVREGSVEKPAAEGRLVLEVAVPGDAPLPDSVSRGAVRRRIAPRSERVVLVFRHPWRAWEVWQWLDPVDGLRVCREWRPFTGAGHSEPPSSPPSSRSRAGARGQRGDPDDPLRAALAAAVHRRAARRLRGASATGEAAAPPLADPLQGVIDAVEGATEPAVVRAYWRALREVAVLDPRCGSGRLVQALRALVPLYEACLERMRRFLDDLTDVRVPHRPEKCSDFRRILARAADPRRFRAPRAFAVHCVLRHNLFGADHHLRGVRGCRQRLLRALHEAGGVADAPTTPNLRHGRMEAGFATRREVERAARVTDLGVADVVDEVERIATTRRILDRMANAGGDPGPPGDDPEMLEARLAAVRERLDGWRAAADGALTPAAVRRWTRSRRPVHLWAEFFEVVERGGFDLVLTEEAMTMMQRSDPPTAAGPNTGTVARGVREGSMAPYPAGAADEGETPHLRMEREGDGYPHALCERLEEEAPPTLFVRGDRRVLHRPLLAIFGSVRVPGSVILRTLDAAAALRDRGVATIGGFQAPLERECLPVLLRGTAPVVVAPARGLDPMRIPAAWRGALRDGRLVLVSGFPGRLRRPTTRTAERRNLLVAALAERVLITHAAPGGRTYRLARTLLEWGTPLFTWDDPHNADLVRLGARPIDVVDGCLAKGGA
jgi:hypothetical protein